MRMPVFIALLLQFACSFSRSEVQPAEGFHSSENSKFYDLAGQSAKQLIAQMKESGPLGKDGKRSFGKTDWTIHWSYRYETRGGAVVFTRVTVTAAANFIVPRKQAPADANDRMAAEWARFSTALMIHERGHAENATRHARQLYAVLHDHGPFASREELEAFVKAEGDKCIADANAEDLAYDKRTRHGDTQGATLHEPSR